MPTKDDFDPAYPLPRFLADQAELGVEDAPARAVAAPRVFKASILIATAAATGIAVLALGDPVALLAAVSASLVGNSSPPSTPAVQSAADAPAPSDAVAQALPPTATPEAPARAEVAASEPTGQDQTEKGGAPPETLFKQFQAWAAEQDAQGKPGQPVQDAPAQVAQNDPAPAAENAQTPYRLVQKRRQVRAAHNARAEVRPQNLRRQVPRVPRAQGVRAERPPVQDGRSQVQDARAQAPAAQNAEPPTLLPLFGQRN